MKQAAAVLMMSTAVSPLVYLNKTKNTGTLRGWNSSKEPNCRKTKKNYLNLISKRKTPDNIKNEILVLTCFKFEGSKTKKKKLLDFGRRL